MTDDTDDLKWPREIWAAERGEFDPTGFYVLSEHATIARFEGDHERDREFNRYVDGDILESTERYYKARLETLSAMHQKALDAARKEGRKQGLEEAMRVAAKMDGEWFQNTYQSSYNKKRYTADAVERMLRKPLHILSEDIAEAIRALIDRPGDPVAEADSFDALICDAKEEAERAMQKFPQPNYVISKVAEEAGEVVKAAIHCAEGREEASEVRGEMKQLVAMLYRLWVEGDGVHGLRALAQKEGE